MHTLPYRYPAFLNTKLTILNQISSCLMQSSSCLMIFIILNAKFIMFNGNQYKIDHFKCVFGYPAAAAARPCRSAAGGRPCERASAATTPPPRRPSTRRGNAVPSAAFRNASFLIQNSSDLKKQFMSFNANSSFFVYRSAVAMYSCARIHHLLMQNSSFVNAEFIILNTEYVPRQCS